MDKPGPTGTGGNSNSSSGSSNNSLAGGGSGGPSAWDESELVTPIEYVGYNHHGSGRGSNYLGGSGGGTAGSAGDLGPANSLFMQIPIVLAYLVADNETMQQACCESGAMAVLTDILSKINQPSSSPEPVNRTAHGDDGTTTTTTAVAVSSPQVMDPMSDVDRLKEGVLVAIAALCSQNEMCREKLSTRGLPSIVRALGHSHPNIRLAACQCIRSLSRSVKQLRTHLMEVNVGQPLYQLVDDPCLAVQLCAMDSLCNVALDFSPMRQLIVDAGGIERFVKLTDSANWDIQIKAIWILKNIVYKADQATVERIMRTLTYDRLTSLIQSQHVDIERHTLGFLRNLATFRAPGNDRILRGLGPARFRDILRTTL
ncbi:armadillo-type protein, partial [Dimargaris cristalligena]